jgi:hypothetical protein
MGFMDSYPKHPNVTVPDDDLIAAAFGIDNLRVGKHFLRDESRARIGCLWVESLWLLHVKPSFHHHGLVGVATAHGEEFKGVASPGWIKAILASNDAVVTAVLDSDPLPRLVERLPLLGAMNSAYLDGVGYSLRLETAQVKSHLSFANPTLPALIAIERTCWTVADSIAHESRMEALTEFTNVWRRYHHDRTCTHPGWRVFGD